MKELPQKLGTLTYEGLAGKGGPDVSAAHPSRDIPPGRGLASIVFRPPDVMLFDRSAISSGRLIVFQPSRNLIARRPADSLRLSGILPYLLPYIDW
jgi:hypothetical protein